MGDALTRETHPPQRSRRRLADYHIGGAVLKLHQVRGQACRDRTLLVRFKASDKVTYRPHPLFEGEPGVPLAPRVSGRQPHRASRDAQGRGPAAV